MVVWQTAWFCALVVVWLTTMVLVGVQLTACCGSVGCVKDCGGVLVVRQTAVVLWKTAPRLVGLFV